MSKGKNTKFIIPIALTGVSLNFAFSIKLNDFFLLFNTQRRILFVSFNKPLDNFFHDLAYELVYLCMFVAHGKIEYHLHGINQFGSFFNTI